MNIEFKTKFIDIYNTYISREGCREFLDYLCSSESDFFNAPCSTKFHGSYPGGLVEHCVNVFNCIYSYTNSERTVNQFGLNFSVESIAIVSLLHDVCKINTYKESRRNVKDEKGIWQSVPYYEFKDHFPYGHGEKSVYIINKYMRLSDEEAFAIRYHMGFSGGEETKNVGDAFRLFPLGLVLSIADMEATFFLEK